MMSKKQKKLIKTLKGKFKRPSVQKLKSIFDYRLTLEIIKAFEEDTHRMGKRDPSAEFNDDYLDYYYF